MNDTPSTAPAGLAGHDGRDEQPVSHTARPYVRSAASANTGPLRLPSPGGAAGAGEGALRESFADLAAAAAAAPGSAELAVYGQEGRGAVEGYDPNAANRAGGQPLLLRSLIDLREVWLPLLGAASVRSVTVLGAENGSTTGLVVELLRAGGGGRLLIVDPEPGRVPSAGRGLDIDVVRDHGAAGLDGHTPTDAYLIDGDANYATVTATLAAVDDAVHEFGRNSFPLVIVHDVGWPTGRRDQYRAPDRLTDADLQPHSWDAGVTLDTPDAVLGRGMRGGGAYAWALAEGGPRNGVRTAVEEFVAGHPELRFFTVAPVLGLGVVVDRRAPFATRVAELLSPWVANPLLARLERNRLELYLRVVATRDEGMAAARLHQQEWAKLDAERMRLVALDIEKSDRIAQLERELAAERAMAAEALGARLEEPRLVAAARSADSRLRARLRRGPSRYEQARARLAQEEQRRLAQLADPDTAGALELAGAAGRLALPPGAGAGADGSLGGDLGAGGDGGLDRGSHALPALPPGSPSGPAAGDPAAETAASRGTDAGRDTEERLRGRHRPHHRIGEPDIVAGGPGHQEPSLWTPGQASADPPRRGRAARSVPPPPPVAPPGEPHALSVPPGAGSGAVLLTPAPPLPPSPLSLPDPSSTGGVSGPPRVPSPLLPPLAGGAPPSPAPPVTPIQSGRPIPAGQPIPPGSAVHPSDPGRPAELGAPGQPPLFDRSGVPRRRRMAGTFAADRHEPRHRASGRNHNPERNQKPDRPS
ncbi:MULTISPECIES: hypothetical protein [unclassified Pseudofrankia]|uniref:hypothetical protein n=1 Tax=unclassified Pseudofrankia TaxID=2994372 RepID=UPI0008DAEB73|nr:MULTISPECIES: hypothetical protein [unclassified Pseudofrankia]MDT3445671.1 hypothetical protein [Pseudofrankia sp. BMG5.37]OHV45392.1 hypothetical protein BCD48_01395 [Pseudofrankia sp. BMG5.36]